MHNASDSDARVRGPDSNASTRRKIRYLGTCQLPYPSGETTPVINSRSLPRSFNNGAENTKLWLAAIHRRAVIILMRAFIAQIK